MIGLDLPAGFGGGVIDHAYRRARLVRRQQGAEPAVGQAPGPPQPGGGRAAQPDVERLGRARADAGAVDGEELSLERHRFAGKEQAQQGERLVEKGSPLAAGCVEHRPFGILGRLQAEDRQHPAGGQPGQRRQLLRHQHRMPAREHRDPGARLQLAGPRQRERQAGERVDQRRVDDLRQPQRIHPGLLEQVDRVREHPGRPGLPQRDADPDLHGPMGSQPAGVLAARGARLGR